MCENEQYGYHLIRHPFQGFQLWTPTTARYQKINALDCSAMAKSDLSAYKIDFFDDSKFKDRALMIYKWQVISFHINFLNCGFVISGLSSSTSTNSTTSPVTVNVNATATNTVTSTSTASNSSSSTSYVPIIFITNGTTLTGITGLTTLTTLTGLTGLTGLGSLSSLFGLVFLGRSFSPWKPFQDFWDLGKLDWHF